MKKTICNNQHLKLKLSNNIIHSDVYYLNIKRCLLKLCRVHSLKQGSRKPSTNTHCSKPECNQISTLTTVLTALTDMLRILNHLSTSVFRELTLQWYSYTKCMCSCVF